MKMRMKKKNYQITQLHRNYKKLKIKFFYKIYQLSINLLNQEIQLLEHQKLNIHNNNNNNNNNNKNNNNNNNNKNNFKKNKCQNKNKDINLCQLIYINWI